MILELLRQRAGVACSGRTLERVLRKIHFSYRKISRPVVGAKAIRSPSAKRISQFCGSSSLYR